VSGPVRSEGPDRRQVRQVQGPDVGAPAHPGRGDTALDHVAHGKGHRRAGAGQFAGDDLPEAAGGPGHHGLRPDRFGRSDAVQYVPAISARR